MNYNQLYYFYKIAENGSIALASKSVLISSPALSMQLKELEESLGAPLFLRVGKKLVLTETGTIVFEYARDIFQLGFELKDTIADRRTEKKRPKIEIGCQDSIPKKVADELLAFLIENKKCKVVLKEGNREQLLKMQNVFKLDLVLANSLPPDHAYPYETKLLCKEELIVVGHPKFKSLKNKWENAPIILPTYESSLRHKLDAFFKEKNISIDIVAEVDDKATEIDLALNGHGVITAMKQSVSHLISQKLLVELGSLKGINEEIWMVIGKRKILNPIAIYAMKNFTLSLQ